MRVGPHRTNMRRLAMQAWRARAKMLLVGRRGAPFIDCHIGRPGQLFKRRLPVGAFEYVCGAGADPDTERAGSNDSIWRYASNYGSLKPAVACDVGKN
jgi:uncharacterized protein YfaA (DUF2138 family)